MHKYLLLFLQDGKEKFKIVNADSPLTATYELDEGVLNTAVYLIQRVMLEDND